MSFQRIRREKSAHFTTINNTVIRDRSLSLKAKGVLLTVMGLPDTWDFSVAGLVSIVKEGKAAVYAAMQELREAGYVEVKKDYENGKIVAWNYIFHERPKKLLTDFQEVENLEIENRQQLKKQVNKEVMNERNNTHIEAFPDPVFDYPMKPLVDAFPNLNVTPAMMGFIEADVKDNPVDREAWAATIRLYQMNYDPAQKRYLPDKVGNLLGVFKTEQGKAEKRQNGGTNGSNQSNNFGRKRTDADVFAESADFYANYEEQRPA